MKTFRPLFLPALLAATQPFLAQAGERSETINGYTWTYYVDYETEETKIYSVSPATGQLYIPSILGGYPVTSIIGNAFRNCSSLVSVNIPSSVTSIGSGAFSGCSNLQVVQFNGTGVASIESSLFSGCSKLVFVSLGDGVTSIGSSAFSGCTELARLEIPATLRSIDSSAFRNCNKLTLFNVRIDDMASWSTNSLNSRLWGTRKLEVNGHYVTDLVIPEGVTSIGSYAFTGCSTLTSITIPNSVTSIGSYAFSDCSDLSTITIGAGLSSLNSIPFNVQEIHVSELSQSYSESDGILFSKDGTTLLRFPQKRIGTYTIPDSVTSIGESAFSSCVALTSVTVPDSVTNIGNSAFSGCSNLAEISIGAGISSLNNIPFNVQEIHVSELSQSYSEIDGVLFSKDRMTLLRFPQKRIGTYTIPNSVTNIGESAFSSCVGLTSVTIPDNVTSIGERAYQYCSSLTSIAIGSGVTSIGSYAFYQCSSLTSATIPNSVTSIGERAYQNCGGLTSITIGTGVTSIGRYSFIGCDGLTAVHISDLSAWCGISFQKNSYGGTTSNPLSCAHRLYLNGVEVTNLIVPNDVTNIGEQAFNNCTGITSVTIPDNVMSIGGMAFDGCTSLTAVHISDLAAWCRVSFGNQPLTCAHHLYLNGEEVKDLVVSNGVTTIADNAFNGGSGFTSVTIPSSVTSIGNSSFSGCTGLTSAVIPDSVTSIKANAFSNCSSLQTLWIPRHITTSFTDLPANCNVVYKDTVSRDGNSSPYFKIYFDSQRGSAVPTIADDFGTPVVLPANPERLGYTFSRWEPSIPTTMPPSNTTCRALWIANQYTISFDSANGSAVISITQDCDSKITAPVNPTRTGYTFADWEPAVPTTMPPSNLVCRAQWTVNRYTISFDSVGGSTVDTIIQDYGTTVTPPATPTREGYEFSGWVPAIPLTLPASNTVCIAKWTPLDYTIHFNGNGAVGAMGDLPYTYEMNAADHGLTVRYYDISTSGYSTWTRSEEAMNNYFASNAPTVVGNTTVFGDGLATGHSDNSPLGSYELNRIANFGMVPLETGTCRFHGQYANSNTEAFAAFMTGYLSVTAAGTYSFAAVADDYIVIYIDGMKVANSQWTTIASGSISLASGNHTISIAFYESGGGQGLTIQWKKPGDSSYTLIPQSALYQSNPTVILPLCSFTKEGHTFLGWATESGEEIAYADMEPVRHVLNNGNSTNVTLFACWSINQYTISFETSEGGEVSSITQDYGTDVIMPANPTLDGYEFSGWVPEIPATIPASNIVCVAQWTPIDYTAHFDANGGTGEMGDAVYLIDDMSAADLGLTIRYYDISTTGYSTWTQSEEAMNNYFANYTPTIVTNSLAFGDSLDSGIAGVERSSVNQFLSWGLNDLRFEAYGTTNRFHGKYAQKAQEYFAAYLTGFIAIPETGNYSFACIADDSEAIFIDGVCVCCSQWDSIGNGSLELTEGSHSFSMGFYEGVVGHGFAVQWKKPGDMAWSPLPQSVLYQSIPGDSLPSCSFVKTGHSFLGWAMEPNGEVAYADRESVGHVFNDGYVTNVTLYAVWGINQYTVSFDSAQGSQVGSITQNYGSSIIPPANPTRTGYSFIGWQPMVPATMPASNTVCTAQWELLTLSLDVASPFGTASPDFGRNLVSWGNRITASITEPAPAYGFRQHCTGWTGTGSVPASGTGTSTTFTIQENSSISWNWERQTWHECTIAGDAAHKTESGWKTFNGADTVVSFSPTARPYRYELSGDTNGVTVDVAAARITLPTDRPRSVTLTVHAYTKEEVVEDGGTPLVWTGSPTSSTGLSIRYYDISSSGYSTWSQSETAMTNYFAGWTPMLTTNTVVFGETLDAGFSPVYTGYTDANRIAEIGSSSMVTNRFHGRYADGEAFDFSALMTGWILVDNAGEYSFRALADDYFAIFIDGIRVCRNQWNSIGSGSIALTDGEHRISIAFHQMQGGHGFAVQWKKPGDTAWSPLPQTVLTEHSLFWRIVEDTSANDGFSFRSGITEAGETSAVEAAIEGAGTLSFDWRISSARGHFARFYVDGVAQRSITRTMDWSTVMATLDDGPHTLRWAYEKGTGDTAGEDAAFLDNVVWTPLTFADALDTDAFVWSTDGAEPWIPQVAVSADGADAVRSGAVTGLDVSALTATVLGAGTLSWSWMGDIAGNAGVDVFLDGDWCDSVWLEGETDWETASLAIAGAGTHTVRFEFWNGGTAETISDCAYIDQVSWTGTEARTLAVASAYGTVSPAVGTHVLALGGQVAASVAAPEPTNGTRRVCTGWTGTGSVPATGTAASVAFTLNEASSIEWIWRTEYWTEITVSGGTCGFSPQWVAAGTQVEVVITSSAHVPAVSLSGDTAGATLDGTTLRFVADRPRTIHVEVQEEPVSFSVASAFGTASPAVGTHAVPGGTAVTASVAAPAPENGTRRICTGWTGTGSVPASGAATNVAFTLEERSSIAWNWRTDYWTEIVVSGGTCGFAPQWVVAGTAIEVAIAPTPHLHSISLSGDTAGATLDGTTLRFAADQPRTIRVDVEETMLSLAVASAHGTASPAVGTHALSWGTAVTASVAEPEPTGGELPICTGWTGTGSVPASGTATNVAFTLEENSSITWTWTTNVWVELVCAGDVEADFEGAWVARGGTVVAHWAPTAPYVAVSLSGDTVGAVLDETEGTLTIPVSAPRALTLSARTLRLAGALDAEGLAWATTAAAPWFPQEATAADGEDAAQSGAVADGAVSALETTLVAPGTLTWSWRLDAQGGDSALRVLLDGEPAGTCVAGAGWTGGTLAIDAIGAHTVRFEFRNDGASADGSRAYLDQVAWTGDTEVTVDGWFDVNFADPGYRAGYNWGDVSQVANPGGTWELNDCFSYLAGVSGNQERVVELNGTTGIVYRATHSSEAEADIRIEGRIRITIGFKDLSNIIGVVGLTILYLDENETQAAPYGIVDGVWVQLQSPSQPLVNDAWHDYIIELDQRSELAPRIRYTLDGESLGLAAGGDSWIPLESAPDGLGEGHFIGFGAIGNFRGIQTKFAVPIADLVIPDLSGPGGLSFDTDGSGNPTFNVRVANPVPGVYYTAFVADTLDGPFLADAASRLAEPSDATITFALAAGDDRPSRFVRIVASTAPFEAGDPLPEETGR